MIPDCSLCKAGGKWFGLYQEKSADVGGKVIYVFEIDRAFVGIPYWLSYWNDTTWSYAEATSILVPGQLI